MGPFYSLDQVRFVNETLVLRNSSNYNNYGLRFYRVEYAAVMKFNFNADFVIKQGVNLFCQIRNIGNNTAPEYLNDSPSNGRGWLMGFRFNISGNK